ncbi:cupredoxin domain-containing protein [Methylobacterium gnaphalii]|nr:cupredoxin family copper-binding protein [Methylobacterium gnaphalii]
MPLTAAYADAVEVVATPASASGEITEIAIKDMAYGPANVKVKRGTIVRWKNDDEVAHNVQLRGGPAKGWDKAQGPMLNKDESYALKFNEAGSYKYICTPHSIAMKGEVIVE